MASNSYWSWWRVLTNVAANRSVKRGSCKLTFYKLTFLRIKLMRSLMFIAWVLGSNTEAKFHWWKLPMNGFWSEWGDHNLHKVSADGAVLPSTGIVHSAGAWPTVTWWWKYCVVSAVFIEMWLNCLLYSWVSYCSTLKEQIVLIVLDTLLEVRPTLLLNYFSCYCLMQMPGFELSLFATGLALSLLVLPVDLQLTKGLPLVLWYYTYYLHFKLQLS